MGMRVFVMSEDEILDLTIQNRLRSSHKATAFPYKRNIEEENLIRKWLLEACQNRTHSC